MITTEGNRDGPGLNHLLHRRLQRRQRDLDVAGVHLHITGVVDVQVLQAVGPQCQRGPRSVVRQIVGHPDGLRPEPSSGAIGGAPVERRPQDHHVGIGVAGRVVEIAFRHAEEGEVGAELGAVASHCTRCSCGRMSCADSCLMVSPRKNAGCRARMMNMKTIPIRIRPRPRISTSPIPTMLAPLP